MTKGEGGEGQRFFAALRMTRGGRWRVAKILRFAQNDKSGTLESDKDSSLRSK